MIMRVSAVPAIVFLALAACAAVLCQQPLPTDLAGKRPNELGKILILEYHLIEPQETRWARSIEHFRGDLEELYQSGYRPIGMKEYIDGRIDLPAGAKAFILTFDDSSPGQFRYLSKDGKNQTDPECAVGMLIAFNKRHPDFRLRGIFFVLPAAKEPHKLFGQPEYEADKLRELVSLGFEIGDHTLWHADLAKYDAATVQKQIALAAVAIQKVIPDYRLSALALPFGSYPRNPDLAARGSYNGISYAFEAVLRVSGGAAPSPFSLRRDLMRLPRIQVPSPDLKYWLDRFEKHPSEVFISDGRPDTADFPRALESEFNAARYRNLRVIAY
jgi:hypothetical protein